MLQRNDKGSAASADSPALDFRKFLLVTIILSPSFIPNFFPDFPGKPENSCV